MRRIRSITFVDAGEMVSRPCTSHGEFAARRAAWREPGEPPFYTHK
jgi:hypothetical protein